MNEKKKVGRQTQFNDEYHKIQREKMREYRAKKKAEQKKKYYCLECGHELTKDMDVCPECDCSINGFDEDYF